MAGRAVLYLSLVLVWAGPAAAERSVALPGLSPAVDSYGLVLVERAQTARRWEVGAQLFLGYTHSPLRLSLTDASGAAGQHNLVRGQASVHLQLWLGLWSFLEVAASLRVAAHLYDEDALGEQVAVAAPPSMMAPLVPTTATGVYAGEPRQNTPLAGAGPLDPSLSVKGRIYRGRRFGVAALATVTLPLGNEASFMGEKSATFRPLLVGDVLLSRLSVAANLGAIIRAGSELRDQGSRDPMKPLLISIGHELYFALGVAARLHRVISAGVEAFGTAPFSGEKTFANVDMLGALYIYPRETLRMFALSGGGLIPESPLKNDFRVLLGISWSPRSGAAQPSSDGGPP